VDYGTCFFNADKYRRPTPFAYITNGESNNISVIDTTTNKVTATISAGSNPVGAAINPSGTKVYVAMLKATMYL
jgi:YVTN family beta-propeller protein